jgi:soluble lytic murein transglycosylase-like protein
MKILTVSAAALAAGLTTFAANALEEGAQQTSMTSARPDNIINAALGGKEKPVEALKEGTSKERGPTPEQVFHAMRAKQAERREQRYKVIIERYASLNGIPVQLAHAVITVESNYRPFSLGKAGEVGLMQIKPATAKLMGYSGSKAGLFDPETNIKYGMKYLGKAKRLGDGTTCGTILKYNAGHAAKRMNPVSQDYCNKVKRHIEKSIGWLWSDGEYDSGV